MNRRAFTATLASVLGLKLPAAAAPVVEVAAPVVFDPVAYTGDVGWINTACSDVWEDRFRAVYQGLSEKYEPAP